MSSDDEENSQRPGDELPGRSTLSEPMPRTSTGGGVSGGKKEKDRQYEGDEEESYSVSEIENISKFIHFIVHCGVLVTNSSS